MIEARQRFLFRRSPRRAVALLLTVVAAVAAGMAGTASAAQSHQGYSYDGVRQLSPHTQVWALATLRNEGVLGPTQRHVLARADLKSSSGFAADSAPTLFRGTSEGFEGGQGALRSGITPASTDPKVAAAFATHAEQFGQGVLHIASPEDLAGLKVEIGSGYLPYESEAFVGTTPADFAARAGTTVSASTARGVLSDMGIYVPGQIGTAGDLTAFLRGSPLMSSEQIAEFLSRIGG